MTKVLIVGAGPAGLFAAQELADSCDVTVIEQKNYIGGSGLYSDGKMNFHPQIGGDLLEFLSNEDALKILEDIKQTFKSYGMTDVGNDWEKLVELERRATTAGIKFIPIRQNHVGSDYLPKVMNNFRIDLEKKGVKFKLNTKVLDLDPRNEKIIAKTDKGIEEADYIVLSPGRIGSLWLIEMAKKLGLGMRFNPVDIGVRVEVLNDVMKEIVRDYQCWDPKFHIRTQHYDDDVRTFCLDYNTQIVLEENNIIKTEKIGDLIEGILDDRIKSTNIKLFSADMENRCIKKSKLVAVSKKPYKEKLIEMKIRGIGKFRFTKDHILFTKKGKEIREMKAKELSLGDKIAVSQKLLSPENIIKEINFIEEILKSEYKNIGNICIRNTRRMIEKIHKKYKITYKGISKISKGKIHYKNTIRLPQLMNLSDKFKEINKFIDDFKIGCEGGRRFNEIPVKLKITPELMRLVGYFVSEGHFNIGKSNYNIVFTNFDKDIRNDIELCIKSLFPNGKIYYNPQRKQILISNWAFYLLLKYVLEIPHRAENKCLPKYVFNLPKNLLKEFLKGLFTGDGSLYEGTLSYASTSYKLISQLYTLLSIYDIHSSFKTGKSSGWAPHSTKKSDKTLFVLKIGKTYLKKAIEIIDFTDPNRHKNFQKIANKEIKDNQFTRMLNNIGKYPLRFNKIMDIKEVEPTKGFVYDISLNPTHNFICSPGLVVHNCVCPYGFVVKEFYEEDIFGVNGHSMKDKKSNNCNFALLVKTELTHPLENTTEYGRSIANQTNTLGGGKPIIQRVRDLRMSRRSNWERIGKSYVDSTLKDVTPGDISMAYPYRIVIDILEALDKLEKVIPGVGSDSTLLYAPEIKFYAMRIETNKMLQTALPNIFVAGDGAGVSRGITIAAATGKIAANGIKSLIK